jgi:hypothetical protein
MSRERRIKSNGVSWIWKEVLKPQFRQLNLEYEEIVFIEEVDEYNYYIAFVKVKSHSEKPEYIEITVTYNSRGTASVSIYPIILNKVYTNFTEGKILLNKLTDQ